MRVVAALLPRGTVHAFTNGSSATAFAYTLYVPPFDGTDRVPVETGDNADR